MDGGKGEVLRPALRGLAQPAKRTGNGDQSRAQQNLNGQGWDSLVISYSTTISTGTFPWVAREYGQERCVASSNFLPASPLR